MTQKITEVLKYLIENETSLDSALDTLTSAFNQAEELLSQYATQGASVRLVESVDPETEPHVTLSWRKHYGNRALCIVWAAEQPGDDGNVVPVVSAPLRIRVEAAEKLPELVAILAKRAHERATAAQKAADSLQALAASAGYGSKPEREPVKDQRGKQHLGVPFNS